MRFKLLISLVFLVFFISGLWAFDGTSEISILKNTPFVDVARHTLQRIDYALKDGSLKPTDDLLDALIPIVKKEPYLLKDALEVLYDLPERMLYSRDDLYQALNQWKARPEVMNFLSQRGGPWKKPILLDVALHGSEEEADRAVSELTQMPLNRRDLEKLITHYLTRHTEQYFYLTQYLRSHTEDIPSVDEKSLRNLTYLLFSDMDCSAGVRLFAGSGTLGLRMIFKRWYQGRLAQGCLYETYTALRKGAKAIVEDVTKALSEEDDPLVKGQLMVFLFDAGHIKEAQRWAETLTEEGALQLVNAYARDVEKLKKYGILYILSKLDRGRLSGHIKSLKRTILCYDLKRERKRTIRDVLLRLSGDND
ncbi:MAG: hypothetical protein D6778_02035, partial [Nitrospirae bacterium]